MGDSQKLLVRGQVSDISSFCECSTLKEAVDPLHAYLSLATLGILPSRLDMSWDLPRINALWNATEETAKWAQEHISAK